MIKTAQEQEIVMKHTLCIGLLFVVGAFAAAQQSVFRSDANPAAEAEVKALESKLAALIVHGDWDGYAQHLAPDYLRTNYNGQVESKQDALAALRDERRKIIVMEPEPSDQQVRIFGDTGIFNGEFTVSVRESGQVKTRRLRLTDVFLRRDDAWHLVAEQVTTIGK